MRANRAEVARPLSRAAGNIFINLLGSSFTSTALWRDNSRWMAETEEGDRFGFGFPSPLPPSRRRAPESLEKLDDSSRFERGSQDRGEAVEIHGQSRHRLISAPLRLRYLPLSHGSLSLLLAFAFSLAVPSLSLPLDLDTIARMHPRFQSERGFREPRNLPSRNPEYVHTETRLARDIIHDSRLSVRLTRRRWGGGREGEGPALVHL